MDRRVLIGGGTAPALLFAAGISSGLPALNRKREDPGISREADPSRNPDYPRRAEAGRLLPEL